MAEMLGEREQKLLAAVPIYLERRFAHWRERHARLAAQTLVSAEASIDVDINVDAGTQVGVDASPPAPDPQEEAQRWLAPGGWLHGFQQDMRQMLLAELQTRLAPVQGLIEAAGAQPH